MFLYARAVGDYDGGESAEVRDYFERNGGRIAYYPSDKQKMTAARYGQKFRKTLHKSEEK